MCLMLVNKRLRPVLNIFLVAAGVTLAATSGLAHAQMLISPVLVDLTAQKKVVAVSVSLAASAPKPVRLQTEVQRWEQDNGEQRLTETDDLLVSPAIVELSPGTTQVFRVALRGQRPGTVEAAYRLILEDVSEIDPAQVKQGSITFRFRYDLPVFVAPLAPVRQSPHWSRCADVAGKVCVRLDNQGNQRIRFSGITVQGQGRREELKDGGTVLAGAWKQWTFDWPANYAGPLTVNAETSAGPLSIELPAPRR